MTVPATRRDDTTPAPDPARLRRFRSAAGAAAVAAAYGSLIDTWLPFAEQRTVRTSAGSTFVLSAGPVDAPAVLLLHGSGSVAASWAPELAALSGTHRVHAVDLLGESGRSAPARPPLSPGTYAGWLGEVAESLGARPATVVGTSLGGWVALDYAITDPAAVQQLVLISTSGIGRSRLAPLVVGGLLGALGEFGRTRALRFLLGRGVSAWTDDFHADLGSLALLTFRHFRPRVDPVPVFAEADVAALQMPVTAVFGEHDRMLRAREAADRLRRLLPASHVVVEAGYGHLVPGQTEYVQRLGAA